MSSPSRQPAAAVDRPLVLRARADMQLAPVAFSGQTAYVLKDPLTLELFHLSAEEFFLFDKLKQSISLKGLQRAFQQRFAPRTITPQQLQHGVNQLHSQGLLLSEASGQGEELRERDRRRRRGERWQSCLKLLSFRLGSIDATSLVDGLHRRVRWMFSWPMLLVGFAVVLFALSILLGHGREMYAKLPSLVELAQPRYWLLWLTTIAAVKVVHELAHAVTCKHVGGRCHEIGVLLLAMIPCLYCDVSDIWRIPSKWRRMAVSAAGMIAELLLASLALVGWWYSQPGLLNIWCLSVVMVCSVGTVLVNANPLLRYDGYYLLADWVEVPNLATRAQGLFPSALRRWLLAERPTEDPLLSARQRRGLLIYAIAARVYLTIVLIGIFALLLTWARPHRLENLVWTLAAITLFSTFLPPLMGVWRVLRNPASRYRMRKPRLVLLASLVAVALAAFFFFPITKSVRGPVVFVPQGAQPVYATSGGELNFAVATGTRLQAGEEIARLANAETELELVRQQGEFEIQRVRYQQLAVTRAWSEQSSARLPTAAAALNDAAGQRDQLQAKAEELSIASPTAGVVIAPPEMVQQDDDPSRLPTWSGSPLDGRNLGSWIEAGTLLCLVGKPDQLEALVMIDQRDVAEVHAGQTVRILLETSPVRVLTGEVVQVARRADDRAQIDPAVDAGKYHLVQVRLNTQDANLLVGSRGTAKIVARRTTLSAIIADQLRQALKLSW